MEYRTHKKTSFFSVCELENVIITAIAETTEFHSLQIALTHSTHSFINNTCHFDLPKNSLIVIHKQTMQHKKSNFQFLKVIRVSFLRGASVSCQLEDMKIVNWWAIKDSCVDDNICSLCLTKHSRPIKIKREKFLNAFFQGI